MKTITKLSVTDGVCLITIANIPNDMKVMASILDAVANAGIIIDMINHCSLTKSDNVSFSFTISSSDLAKAMNVLGCYKQEYPKLVAEINSDNTKFCIYGELMASICGVASDLFKVLVESGIELKLITTSETDISILVSDTFADTAAAILQKHYDIKI